MVEEVVDGTLVMVLLVVLEVVQELVLTVHKELDLVTHILVLLMQPLQHQYPLLVDGDILVEHTRLVHILDLVVVEQLPLVVLEQEILLVLVVLEQHILFWEPLMFGLEVVELELNLVALVVLVALVAEAAAVVLLPKAVLEVLVELVD
jgi:hypothetical protein